MRNNFRIIGLWFWVWGKRFPIIGNICNDYVQSSGGLVGDINRKKDSLLFPDVVQVAQ